MWGQEKVKEEEEEEEAEAEEVALERGRSLHSDGPTCSAGERQRPLPCLTGRGRRLPVAHRARTSGDIASLIRRGWSLRGEGLTTSCAPRPSTAFTNEALEGESEFVIKIHDINDNEPRFTKDLYMARVPEMSEIGTSVIQVTATDADDSTYGNSAKVVYSILEGQPYFSFSLTSRSMPGRAVFTRPEGRRGGTQQHNNTTTGLFLIGSNRCRETSPGETHEEEEKDKGKGGERRRREGRSGEEEEEEEEERYQERGEGLYEFRVPETDDLGATVGLLRAVDADIGENAEMEYRIISSDGPGMFDIFTNKSTQEGVIAIRRCVAMAAMESDTRKEHVTRINQHAVLCHLTREKCLYEFRVPETDDLGATVGLLRAVDADIGENAEMEYRIISSDGPGMFDIFTNKSTQEGVIAIRRPLDFERKRQYSLRVQVENVHLNPRFFSTSFRNDATVKILVEDVDEPPVFERASYVMEVKEDAARNTAIGTVSASDPDADHNLVRIGRGRGGGGGGGGGGEEEGEEEEV
ncbi:hypothetical protein CRUP_027741 [Coryphaenoides rupestris]|nr:hypothetical protein CRUP_027741 [Coryphaenoides rupestris]